MSTLVLEQIWAELVGEGRSYHVLLDVTVRELHVDEKVMPVSRAIANIALSPMSGMSVEDGRYELSFVFNGKPEKKSTRVEYGTLLAG